MLPFLVVAGALLVLIFGRGESTWTTLASEATDLTAEIALRAGYAAPFYERDPDTLRRHGLPHAEWRGVAYIFVRAEGADLLEIAENLAVNEFCPRFETAALGSTDSYAHYAVTCVVEAPLLLGSPESASVVTRPGGGYYVFFFLKSTDPESVSRLRPAIDAVIERRLS